MGSYGKELILDLHNCNTAKFNRTAIGVFFDQACEMIGAEAADRFWWDDVGVPPQDRQTDPRLVGTSAVQFILTSNLTLHTLDLLGHAYLNVFSCDDFDADALIVFAAYYFGGTAVQNTVLERK